MDGKKIKKRKLKYFFLDQKLYKIIKIDRPKDLVYVWDYDEHRRRMFIWSDAQRRLQHAFTMTEVAKMMNRHRMRIDENLRQGNLRWPSRAYAISTGHPGTHYFSEDNVLEVHDFFISVHRGRPRNDGLITNSRIPTRKELKAMMRYDKMTFIQDDNGEYIPAWKERNW